MMITNKKRLDLDIWPKATNKNINTKDIIFTIWYKETMK